jgi:hypothetical protein
MRAGTRVLRLVVDWLIAQARLVQLFLLLALSVLIVHLVTSGAGTGWIILAVFLGLMLMLLFWALVTFWAGVVRGLREPEDADGQGPNHMGPRL